MDKKEATLNTYNSHAAEFVAKFNRTTGTRLDEIKRSFQLISKDHAKVLELGCGNGSEAREILKYTDDYIGTDISEEMIRLARKNLPDARFDVADMETYEFPESLDIIFAFAVLLHVDKDIFKAILKKGYRALNPGGIFHITLKKDAYHEKTVIDAFGERTFYFYEMDDVRLLAAETGYKMAYEDAMDLFDVSWIMVTLRKPFAQ